ncbi:MAG: TraI domain-containing protein [Gammaproteobacteria bacterium]|nr:TraI domain-containing protein [Gammaproteobacteria bacterium]
MFNGMYDLMNKLKKKPITDKIALQKNATPLLTAEELLSTEKRQQILSDIRTLLNLPDEEYNRVFLRDIHAFVLFVQNLPETERSFYASLGGLLDHALERASLSLFLARTYLLPEGTTLSSVSEEEMLWVYAIFTASLLLDVGKIPTRHIVSLTDKDGNVSELWQPFAGPMEIKENKTHYVFGFEDVPNDHLRWMITPLLARQIISAEGFTWLASNEEVLQAWIGLLTDDQREMGWLKVIPLADAQILESYFSDRKVFRHALSPQTIALINKIIKERKEAQKRQKELGERILTEHAEKAVDTKSISDEAKINKSSTLFGVTSLASQEKLKSAAQEIKSNAKDAVRQFINWLHQAQESPKSTDAKIDVPRVAEGAVITNDVINKFVSDNKQSGLTAQQIREHLIQSTIAVSVAYAQQSGVISPALLVINPYVAYPAQLGVPPIGMGIQVFPPQVIPEVQPATPTQAAPTEAAKIQSAFRPASK